MSLYTVSKPDDIPPNAIKLSRSEALTYQKRFISDWEDSKDVIFLRNAKYLAAGVTLASSYVIVKHLRKMFKFGNKFVISTYLPPLILGPGALFYNFDKSVTDNVLVMELKCPLCWQLKYSLKQTMCGVVFPIFFGCLNCFTIADFKNILPNTSPNTHGEPKLYFQNIYKFCKSGATRLQILASLHILTALFWPYMQNIELSNISRSFREKMITQNEL